MRAVRRHDESPVQNAASVTAGRVIGGTPCGHLGDIAVSRMRERASSLCFAALWYREMCAEGRRDGAGVYKKLTGKDVVFEFPVQEATA